MDLLLLTPLLLKETTVTSAKSQNTGNGNIHKGIKAITTTTTIATTTITTITTRATTTRVTITKVIIIDINERVNSTVWRIPLLLFLLPTITITWN